jgi:hypothetical protein
VLKRFLLALAVVAALLVVAYPALTADQPKTASAAAQQAPALSAEHAAKLAQLQRLAAPDPKFALPQGVLPVLKTPPTKKEISCGVYLNPPNPNPAAVSQRIFWINTTGQTLPVGTHIQWQVEGYPPSCCSGTTGPSSAPFPPNPPSTFYFYSGNPVLMPPQPWTRACKAWAILP